MVSKPFSQQKAMLFYHRKNGFESDRLLLIDKKDWIFGMVMVEAEIEQKRTHCQSSRIN